MQRALSVVALLVVYGTVVAAQSEASGENAEPADNEPVAPTPPLPADPAPAPPLPPAAAAPVQAKQATPTAVKTEPRRLTADELGKKLYQAAGSTNLDEVKSLIQQGADVEWTEKQNGWTVLSHVAQMDKGKSTDKEHQDHVALAAYLIQQRADVDNRDARGRTPLFHATKQWCCEAMFKELLKHAKDLKTHDNYGVTALNVAARENNLMAAKLLMAAGADPHKGDSFGGSAYHEVKNGKNNDMRALFNLTAHVEPRASPERRASATMGEAAPASPPKGDL